MINATIYVIFNADFHKGFKDLLLCNCWGVAPQQIVRTRGLEIGKDNEFVDGIRPLSYRAYLNISHSIQETRSDISSRDFATTAL